MKAEIIRVLSERKKARQREIASEIGKWTADPEFIEALRQLEDDGVVKARLYRDIGNMESYYLYSLTK